MGEGVDVDVGIGGRRGVGARRRVDDAGSRAMGRGGGRGGELRRELAEACRCWLFALDQAERGDVPERGACRRCRARPPSRRAARTGSRSPARIRADQTASPAPGGATCRAASRPAAARAATASGRTLDGPQPKRPSAGQEVGRDRNVAGSSARSLCHPGRREPDLPTHCRHRRVGHAGRRRQGQGAEGRRVRTSSASAPASPTSRRPTHIVEAAVAACRDPKNHHYTPAAGLPELREAIAVKTKRDSGFDCTGRPGAGHQRRQARRLHHVRRAARPGRRGHRAGAVLDDLPRGRSPSPAACRSSSPPTSATGFRVTLDQLEAARHRPHQGAAVRVARQPDRRRLPARRGRGHRPVGARARHLGRHRRDLRAPHLRRPRVHLDADARARARRHAASSSTASPRPTP